MKISLKRSIGLKPIPLEQIRIPDSPEIVSTSDPIIDICASSVLLIGWLICSMAPSSGSSLISVLFLIGLGYMVLMPSADSRTLHPVPAVHEFQKCYPSKALEFDDKLGESDWLRLST